MNRPGTYAALALLLGAPLAYTQGADVSIPKSPAVEIKPSAEMQKLLDAFAGNWKVSETFEIGVSPPAKSRQGTATFHAGPGYSLIEDYRSNGTAGSLRALAVLWWDQPARLYRILTCANNDGCQLRGTVRWEGRELVNAWEETVDGKPATFKDSFVDISPSSFRLVSVGTASGRIIWRVVTKYERLPGGRGE